jgi:fibrillarin-like rRNA methylase
MAGVSVERLVQELEKLKQQMDTETLKAGEYDERLARVIRELRERKLDADRPALAAALADALKRGVITPAVKTHLEKRLGL